MKAVVDYVHTKGLSFGLYTCSGTETCVGGRPGSFGHWQQDADVFAEWGVDWVKQVRKDTATEVCGKQEVLTASIPAGLLRRARGVQKQPAAALH